MTNILLRLSYLLAVVLLACPAASHAASTTRVSVSSSDEQGNFPSYNPYPTNNISTDGRYVAFASGATNLVAGDTNGMTDVFVHDRQTGQTSRVSVSSTNGQGGGESYPATISADGRYVVFASSASNLIALDFNNAADIFVHDRQTGTTTLVSKAMASNSPGNGNSIWSSISGDGRYVTFSSDATNLVSNDTNGKTDIFFRDLQTGTTRLVSFNAAGSGSGNNWSENPAISEDGRYVAFESGATNLIANDLNNKIDVFVRDLITNQTTRVSLDAKGNELNRDSIRPTISADGRFVSYKASTGNNWSQIFVYDRMTHKTKEVSVNNTGAEGNGVSYQHAISADGQHVTFTSSATNLVAGDSNGGDDVFVRNLADFPWPMFLPAITGKR